MSVGVNPSYRNKGLAKRCGQDVLNQAKKDPKVKEISWAADKTNSGSISTAKSLGFKHWYDYEDDTVYIYER